MILKSTQTIQEIFLTPSNLEIFLDFKKKVIADGGIFEAIECLFNIDTITFTNETTKEVLNYQVANVVPFNYYYIVNLALDLVENETYLMQVFADNNEVFKTLVFCTNQNPDDFSINNNRYTQRASNNQYKVYE